MVLLAACATLHKKTQPAGPVYTFDDVSMTDLRNDIEGHRGQLFEGRVKYYHTYHSREDADPTKRMQVILGKTHFTARPVYQYTNVIEIQITPEQDKALLEHKVHRQDVLKVRLRFAGLAPGGALAFDLLDVLDW